MDTPGLARFLTLADTAELLNITTDEAYALVRSGELPAIRIGARGVWRVERAVLESYIGAMYEATRRMGMWNQGDFANVLEPAFGERRAHSAPTGR
jgi:excisionase family DNA binding protein